MRVLLACVLTALLAPATVTAHQSQSSRVHNARHIAQEYWGDGQCEGVTPMTVPIGRGPMPPEHPEWVAYIARGGGPPYAGCRIVLKDQPWTTEYLCRVISHEVGHMAGREHSPDPGNIMFAGTLAPWPPCAFGAAEPARAADVMPNMREAEPPARKIGITVLLLPGGAGRTPTPPRCARGPMTSSVTASAPAPSPTHSATSSPPSSTSARSPPPNQAPSSATASRRRHHLRRPRCTGLVAGAVNIAGPTDFERWISPFGSPIMRQIGMTTREQKRAASPFWMLKGRQTPQLVQCGLADPLVEWPQCQRYAAAAYRGQPDTRLHSLVNGHSQSARDRDIAREWIHARWP